MQVPPESALAGDSLEKTHGLVMLVGSSAQRMSGALDGECLLWEGSVQ